jgi:hypothetical protein
MKKELTPEKKLEKRKEYNRQYRLAHHEEIREYAHHYRASHPAPAGERQRLMDEQIRALYCDTKLTPGNIAKMLSVSTLTILNRLGSMGIPEDGRFCDPVRERWKYQERNIRICDMRREGLTLRRIGTEFDLTKERVRQILKRHGVCSKRNIEFDFELDDNGM